MKIPKYIPIPPLPPLPPMPMPGNVGNNSQISSYVEKPSNICHLANSDKKIWKVGLSYKDQELDVVFGDLNPDPIMGNVFNPKINDQLYRSIIIPSHASIKNRPGEMNACDATRILKHGGTLSFSGTLNSQEPQMPGIKNNRFKEYLNKYFPKENVIMQPIADIIKTTTEHPVIAA